MRRENGEVSGNRSRKKTILAIIAVVVIAIVALGSCGGGSSNKSSSSSSSKAKKVEVTDFSSMSQDDAKKWCGDNKLTFNAKEDYSDTVAEGGYISQDPEAGKKIRENQTVTVVYSKGHKPTTEEKNALAKAKDYSEMMHMSKQGIYDQLTSQYGEQFEAEPAQYAIDHLKADYKKNALAKAKDYQDTMHMSKQGIYDQLTSEYGEKFTAEEAQYAIDHLDD